MTDEQKDGTEEIGSGKTSERIPLDIPNVGGGMKSTLILWAVHLLYLVQVWLLYPWVDRQFPFLDMNRILIASAVGLFYAGLVLTLAFHTAVCLESHLVRHSLALLSGLLTVFVPVVCPVLIPMAALLLCRRIERSRNESRPPGWIVWMTDA